MASSVNSAAGRETQPLSVQTSGRNGDRDHRQSDEAFPILKLILNIVLTVATVGAFAAAAIYASYAKQQAHSADITAREAIVANAMAHNNVVQDLRAYVSVGAPQGEPAQMLRGPSPKPSIRIHFVNTGRTPARHFSFLLWSDLKQGNWIGYRQAYAAYGWEKMKPRRRFQIVNCPYTQTEICKQIYHGLGGQDATLGGSQAQLTEDLPDEWTPPTNAFLATTNRYFVVYGVFEYCDIFGQHHCDSFQYIYAQDRDRLINVPATFAAEGREPPMCPDSSLLTDPIPEPMVLEGKKYQWTEMPRCEQQTEKEYGEQ
jgi:hypothetical protein